jgi:serine/threonine-protein kinase
MAVPPPSVSTLTETVEPSTTTTPSATSTTTTTPTTTSPTTSGAPLPGVSGTDAQGFVGHSARCDAGTTPAAAIRTANSLAVVCQAGQGSYYYRGERLSDGANLQLANAVPAGGGFDVTNPADGARYEVRPDHLTIYSKGRVDSAEPALEYSPG